ncbi:hypothetical protein DRO58_07525, partial [Candidatus Bathyarchaeota archaeon]
LVLTYLYVLDFFKPTYWSFVHRVTLDRAFNLGILNQGFYGVLPIFTVAAALNVLPYLTRDIENYGGDGLAIAHTLLLMTIPLYLIRVEELTWLLPALSGLIMVSKNLKKEAIPGFVRDLFLILTITEGLTLSYWVVYLWNPQTPSEGFRWVFKVEAGIFQVHALIYPILLLATLYSWLLLPSGIFSGLKSKLQNMFDHRDMELAGKTWMRLGLGFTLTLSILLPLIPYCPSLNPYFKPVSTDIRYYRKWLENMIGLNLLDALEYAFYGQSNGDRPLYLLLLYGLTCLGIPEDLVLNLEALLISPIFALSVYFSAKRLSRNHLYAVLASLAGVLGFNMTVGMAAGFFAAWTAMAFFYPCIALAADLDQWKPAVLTALIILSLATLFIHLWTWSLLMIVLALHLIISGLRNVLNGRFSVDKWLLIVLAVNIAADFLKTMATPQRGGLETAMATLEADRFIAFEHLFDQGLNLKRLSTSYIAGSFYNPLHMILGFIGTLSLLLKHGGRRFELISIWIAVISLVFPFSTLSLQAHLLLAAPFPLLVAEGLLSCSNLLRETDGEPSTWLLLLFLTSSLSYTFKILCNLI